MISNIVQDSKGFIWYTSTLQLSRYDGIQHKHYDIGLDYSKIKLDQDAVKGIVCTSDGLIWGATDIGLFTFNTKNSDYVLLGNVLNQDVLSQAIVSIQKGEEGTLYFCTSTALYKLNYLLGEDSMIESVSCHKIIGDLESRITKLKVKYDKIILSTTKELILILLDEEKVGKRINWESIGMNNIVVSAIQISGEYIVLGSKNDGIILFDKALNYIENIKTDKYRALLSNGIEAVQCINDQFWIGNGAGLCRLSIVNDVPKVTNHTMLLSKHVKHRNIHSLYKDNAGVLWIGTYSDGLLKMVSSPVFYRFIGKTKFGNTIPYMAVGTKVQMDKNGNIFFLTNNKIEIFKTGGKSNIKFNNIALNSFLKDDEEVFISGSSETSIYKIDENFKLSKKETIHFLNGLKVADIIKDKSGAYWISTFSNQLFRFTKDVNGVILHKEIFKPIDAYYLPQVIKPLSNGDVLIYSIRYGLSRYFSATGELKKINIDDPEAKVNLTFSCIEEDLDGNIWLGSRKKIYIISKESSNLIQYSHEIPGMIFNLVVDRSGDMWGCSQNRIFKIDRETRQLEYLHDRIGDYEFSFYMNRGYQLSNGDIALCMTNGNVLLIYPEKVNVKVHKPKTNIVALVVNNKELKVGDFTAENQQIKAHPAYTEKIVLNHSKKNVRLGFSSSDYSDQDNVQFFYKLNGVDQDWTSVFHGNNFVNYTNLVPGEYEFLVKASFDGIENAGETTKLEIKVKHPWYANVWAYVIYTIIILLIVITILKYAFDKVKLRQQLKIERFKHDQENELNNMKLQFFTNISHEFKTPLTLLVGPLKSLMNKTVQDQERDGMYSLMLRNTERLMRLINQLMDFRKISNEKYDLRVVKNDIKKQIRNIIQAFEGISKSKDIRLNADIGESVMCWYDPDILDKVLNNLLSNAFKYSDKGDTVEVHCHLKNEEVHLQVKDSGIGISKAALPHVFERFYQAKDSNDVRQGTGIGLALCKELVLLHKGKIDVQSQLGEGSVFNVTLPVNEEAFAMDVVYGNIAGPYSNNEELTDSISDKDAFIQPQEIDDNTVDTSGVLKTVLIVEDDPDLRQFISQYLSGNYRVKLAENGKIGLEKALKYLPDLVVSDVMMPEMNGLEFCRKLKTDINISHIPVILLTAKTQLEQKIEGIRTGADAYITKPFDPQYLISVINNLIEGRQKLREKWDRKFIELTPDELAMTNADEIFLDKVIKIVEENISNPDFKLEDIYDTIGMGRTLFLQKVKALTNQTCGDFVRSLRLKRAAYLLEHHDVRISDLCYDVGFNDPKYFGKVFKKYYEVSPSEYARQHKKE